MIYLRFSLSWPYKKQKSQIDYVEKTWTITKNKSLELQISKWGHSWTLIGIEFRPSMYQSHSGLFLELELFNYSIILNFCDNRHWDYKEGKWEEYGASSQESSAKRT